MPDGAVHMVVRGRVQGVGFRFFARDEALQYGVTGWVKNLPDGSVEVYAEGEGEVLSAFIERMKEGPGLGYVTDVEVERRAPYRAYTGFRIEF